MAERMSWEEYRAKRQKVIDDAQKVIDEAKGFNEKAIKFQEKHPMILIKMGEHLSLFSQKYMREVM